MGRPALPPGIAKTRKVMLSEVTLGRIRALGELYEDELGVAGLPDSDVVAMAVAFAHRAALTGAKVDDVDRPAAVDRAERHRRKAMTPTLARLASRSGD